MSSLIICIIIFIKKALLSSSIFGSTQTSSTTKHSFINTSCLSWTISKNHPSSPSLSNPTSPCLISSMFVCITFSSKSKNHFSFKMLFFWSTNLGSVTWNIPISFRKACSLFLYLFLPYLLLFLFFRPFYSHYSLISSSSMMPRPIMLTNGTSARQETFTWRLQYHQYFYEGTISRWLPTKAMECFTCPLLLCSLSSHWPQTESKCCRMCVAPSRADFWSVVMLGIMPIFLRCFFSKCGIDLNNPITTGIPFVFLFHTLALSTMKSRYLSVVSKIIFWTVWSAEMTASIIWHLFFCLLMTIKCGLPASMIQSTWMLK